MSPSTGAQHRLTLYADHSEHSQSIRNDLERAGADFQVVYVSGTVDTVPAIESSLSVVRGYKNIRRYLLPEEK